MVGRGTGVGGRNRIVQHARAPGAIVRRSRDAFARPGYAQGKGTRVIIRIPYEDKRDGE